jgi:microcystin-dependent protein
MSDPFIGEIRPVGFLFAPQGWAMCNGQLLPISQNTPLFSLLGNSYGGDGRATFALPNLQARIPLHANGGTGAPGLSPVQLGEQVGSSSVTLTAANLAPHNHVPAAVQALGTTNSPAGATWAVPTVGRVIDQTYATTGGTAPMAASAVGATGGGQPHNNMPPYLVINFIIALQGIYPPRQ